MEELRTKDFLSMLDVNKEELEAILDTARKFKKQGVLQTLKGKNVALIFQKPSTRTRVSFEVAVNKLGGSPISLNWNELQLGRGETVEDTAKVLERYVDCVVARVFSHDDLVEMSKVSKIPIVNALSDLEHPCQTLADLLTIDERVGFKNVEKIAYVGDGNNNVTHSLILGCSLLGLPITVASPKGYEPRKDIVDKADSDLVKVVNDPIEAAKDADVVITDVFISMGMEAEKEIRMKVFPPYQVNASLVKHAKKNYKFMHCMPIHRNQEATDEVVDSINSVIFDEAENGLWCQASLLAMII